MRENTGSAGFCYAVDQELCPQSDKLEIEAVRVMSEQLAGEEEEDKRLRERNGEMDYIQRMDTGHRMKPQLEMDLTVNPHPLETLRTFGSKLYSSYNGPKLEPHIRTPSNFGKEI
ncbi:hypothetical protein KIL84_014682 [Mauremys mutica]|uniref:Uncharacterized protein n=1 Tax=Mauremys mutica TaxID=74926 RepID=A0A9D4B7W4_9SAUR|nr:hypothetical protein KIL84_014682 [Mauremys mutica]